MSRNLPVQPSSSFYLTEEAPLHQVTRLHPSVNSMQYIRGRFREKKVSTRVSCTPDLDEFSDLLLDSNDDSISDTVMIRSSKTKTWNER